MKVVNVNMKRDKNVEQSDASIQTDDSFFINYINIAETLINKNNATFSNN